MKKNIFWKLGYYRRIRHLTQDQLAKKLNIERYRIADWEQGRSQPSINNLIDLADALDVSFLELIDIDDINKNIKKSSEEKILSTIRKK